MYEPESFPNAGETVAKDNSALKSFKESHRCRMCDRLVQWRCPLCDQGSYCSARCASQSPAHRFRCAGRALTTADYLESAVLADEIPDDPQTMEDLGFDRCKTWFQQSHLLGLYIGLFQGLNVSSDEIDSWNRNGTLIENIISKYETLPKHKQGGYFPWFINNRHILEKRTKTYPRHSGNQLVDAIRDAAVFLGLEDHDKRFKELQPVEKRDCFLLFAMAQKHMHPNPMGPGDLWYRFGFCICGDEHDEGELGSLYSTLLGGDKFRVDYAKSLGEDAAPQPGIPKASFEQFWTAYNDGEVIPLMDRYGLEEGRRRFPGLGPFLALRHSTRHPMVWRLKHSLAFEAAAVNIPAEALLGAQYYGFSSSLNARTRIELRSLYKSLMGRRDPLEIERARSEGRLFSYAQERLPSIESNVAQVLQQLG